MAIQWTSSMDKCVSHVYERISGMLTNFNTLVMICLTWVLNKHDIRFSFVVVLTPRLLYVDYISCNKRKNIYAINQCNIFVNRLFNKNDTRSQLPSSFVLQPTKSLYKSLKRERRDFKAVCKCNLQDVARDNEPLKSKVCRSRFENKHLNFTFCIYIIPSLSRRVWETEIVASNWNQPRVLSKLNIRCRFIPSGPLFD